MPRFQGKTEPIALENELKSLHEISSLVQESPATEESLEAIIKSISRLVDFRSASLYVLSEESGKLDEICSIGRTVDLINFVNFDMGTGISAWVAQKKRPIILNNLRKSQGGTHTKSFLSVPLISGSEVRGVINMAHDEPDSFTQRDAELITVVSSLLSLIVERIEHAKNEARAGREIESLNEKLKASAEKMDDLGNFTPTGDTSKILAEKIYNPLSIIAGNAQFLLMTMKNPGPSVLKRLKAIDAEATSLMSLTGRMQSSAEFRNRETVDSLTGER